jgi:spermidine/putrescine transport system permease protein
MIRRSFHLALYSSPLLAWMIVCVILPISYLFIISFWSVQGPNIVASWNLDNYRIFFENPVYWKLFIRTINTALLIASLSVLITYPVAYFISRKVKKFRAELFLLFIIPLWMSYLIRIFSWKTILDREGLINYFLMSIKVIHEPIETLLYSNFSVTIALLHISLPYAFLPIYTALENIPTRLTEASKDLGAGNQTTFWRIVFPLSLPGVVAGFSLPFVMVLGDYLTPSLLGSPSSIFFGNTIVNQFGRTFNWPLGAALGFILFAAVLLILVTFSKLGSRKGYF